ncbi:MAG TPA: nucleotidyltransferase domain-containing protein [bacterium]|nr:nucleotidyltransferase domain-containing protein [bacterium]
MADPSTVKVVKSYLAKLNEQGFEVVFGVLFGSHATGHAGKWSDIDLLIVSPLFDEPYSRKDFNQLWRLAARVDSRIEPIACGERQWEEDDRHTIIEIARREGEKISISCSGG